MHTLLLLLAACTGTTEPPIKDGPGGDADADTDTDADTDADTDTDTKDTGDTAPPAVAVDTGYYGPTRIVMLVDGATGSGSDPASVVIYEPGAGTSTTVSGITVRADAVVDCAGNFLFVLEARGADGESDRVLAVDPDDASYTEWALGNNFKPVDVAAVGTEYWVANWGKNRLSTFAEDGTSAGFVNLEDYADADGVPEADGVYPYGDSVFVTIARQGQTDGSLNGAQLLEVDPDTKTVTRSLSLAGTYPSGRMLVGGDTLHVHHRSSDAGDGALNADGGVETVDWAKLTSGGLSVDDSTTGLTQSAAAFDPFAAVAWFATTDSAGAPSVRAVALFDGAALQSWPVSNAIVGLGVADGSLWLGENPYAGGDGALVGRSPTDGTEATTVSQDGRVRALTVCASGAPASPIDTGGE